MGWYNVTYIKELNDSNYIFGLFRNLVYSLYKQVDGIGKTTQAKLLVNWMNSESIA
jgi:hypothetical protein